MTAAAPSADPADDLMTPDAVRARCCELLQLGLDGKLPWFRVDPAGLDTACDRVVGEIRANYPSLDVPFHSRWRHFEFDGTDLWAEIAGRHGLTGTDLLAAAGDLAVVSVLLDAGAGPDWQFNDGPTGLRLGRSEGLALASLRLFESGLLSAHDDDPLRADAARLSALTPEKLAAAMQVSDRNPLVGLPERTGLLRNLGNAIAVREEMYASDGSIRPGNLLLTLSKTPGLKARDILIALIENLTEIWPSPVRLAGRPLGDVWRHGSMHRDDVTDGLVPFHKLSQWLSYSLIEPLQHAGVSVAGLDGLTGLAEYRNGGLFIDTGTIVPTNPALLEHSYKPGDELIVEWRALTVALLDRVADRVRTALDRTQEQLPLASVLQGGTWSAGRSIAAELRQNGGPPIHIDSDATVF